MKKMISILLVFAMVLPLCGCGKSKAVTNVEELISAIGEVSLESGEAIASAQRAYDALTGKEKAEVENYNQLIEANKKAEYLYGKEAYDNIRIAWEIAEQAADDVYVAWEGFVNQKDKVARYGVAYFTAYGTCPLEEATLVEGFAKAYYQGVTTTNLRTSDEDLDDNWKALSEADKDVYRNHVIDKTAFEHYKNIPYVIHGMWRAYDLDDSPLKTAQAALEQAKAAMKVLLEEYADYVHYPNLKGFYTTASSLLDECSINGTHGSFDQYKVILKDYRKEASDYMSALDFIFIG